jgi:uncharacterized membrane protein
MKKIDKTKTWNKIKSYIPLAVLLVIFCAICVPTLLRPIWFDEAYSSNLVRGDFGQIVKMTALDVHPPLYYWILKVWTIIFGRSIFGMRVLSVVFGVLTLIFAYILFKRWSKNHNTALFLTTLLAACPFFIYYSGEMRMYSLSCFIVMAGTLFLDVALEKKNKKIYWILYLLSIIAALYTHYFAVLAFGGHFIYLILHFKKYGFNKNIIWVYLLAIIAYLPWIPTLLGQVHGVEQGYWPAPIEPITFMRFFSFSFVYYEGIENNPVHFVMTVIVILILLIMACRKLGSIGKKTKEKILLLSLITFIPPLIMAIISLVGQSIYVERYITYSLALLWVIYGIFALTTKDVNPKIFKCLVIFLVICFCFGIRNIYKSISENDSFREISIYINEIDSEHTPIVYYNTDAGAVHMSIYETELHPVYSYDIDTSWGAVVPIVEYNRNYIPDLDKFLEETDNFWYVTVSGYNASIRSHSKIKKLFDKTEDYRAADGFIAIHYVKKQK